ncbi:MAG TPA: FMN-binding protein [Candidatus Bathyarchaeia archaeon]|nr:FMN-binding protein [Candidatus Bathyarchaeia archaeon]
MTKIFYRALFAGLIALFVIGWLTPTLRRTSESQTSTRLPSALYKLFPEADHATPLADEQIYQEFDSQNKLLGYGFLSSDFVATIQGYGGPIQLAIALTPDGKIQDLKVVHHQETPEFTRQLPNFVNQFIGQATNAPFVLSKNVDGISGATITSQAMIATLNATLAAVLPKISSVAAASPTDPRQNAAGPTIFWCFILMLMFILAIISCRSKKTVWRWLTLTCGFLVLGIIGRFMLSSSQVAQIALGTAPGFFQNPRWYMLMIGAVGGAIVFGRIYCTGVCPFAFLEEAIFKINQKFLNRPFSPRERTDFVCRWFKYLFLLGLLALCLIENNASLAGIEVYTYIFGGRPDLWQQLLISVIAVGSFFYLRFWCKYLCPFGAFLGLFAQFRLWRPRTPENISPICSQPAECFYCDRCLCSQTKKSTAFQHVFFIILLVSSIVCLGVILFNRTMSLADKKPSAVTMKTMAVAPAPLDIQKIKTQLEDAGLSPRPAKHWRELQNE